MDCVAFGAHPDDVELFAGGLLALSAARGHSVGIVHMTRGERATRGSVQERKEEAFEAAEILGIPSGQVRFLDLGDTLLENTEANRLVIVRLLREWCPRIVLYHYPEDRHPDHRKAHQLVEEAFFYARLSRIETGQSPFGPSHGLQFYNHIPGSDPPSFVVDISEVFHRKMDAVRAYRSQFYNPDYPGDETYISSREYFDQIEVRARYYGGLIGARYGEPFRSPRPLPVADPIALLGAPR